MVADKLIRVDGVKWWETMAGTIRTPVPVCPEHHLRLNPVLLYYSAYSAGRTVAMAHSGNKSTQLKCEDDGRIFDLPRTFGEEKQYVLAKIDAQIFAKMPTISLDDELIPVAKKELKDTDYWILAKVTKSKSGTRLIVWAGSKKDKNKAQLFVEPELQRMSFDQNDDHPTEVFAKVEATFKDGAKTTIEKS
jgi:hypothetical protein